MAVGILMNPFGVRLLLVPPIAMLLGRWNLVWPHSSLLRNTPIEAEVVETQSVEQTLTQKAGDHS
jgi:uncharacterized membrane protein YdfJ with MMPL/SSD domain